MWCAIFLPLLSRYYWWRRLLRRLCCFWELLNERNA